MRHQKWDRTQRWEQYEDFLRFGPGPSEVTFMTIAHDAQKAWWNVVHDNGHEDTELRSGELSYGAALLAIKRDTNKENTHG